MNTHSTSSPPIAGEASPVERATATTGGSLPRSKSKVTKQEKHQIARQQCGLKVTMFLQLYNRMLHKRKVFIDNHIGIVSAVSVMQMSAAKVYRMIDAGIIYEYES